VKVSTPNGTLRTKLRRPRVIVLDLDGTLIDSARDLADAVNEVLEHRGRSPWPVATIRRWIGQGAERLMERALSGGDDHPQPDPGETAEALAAFRSIYASSCTRHTTLYDGAIETLQTLRARGLRTAILTNKPANQTATILKAYGLDELTDAWLGGDSPFGRKPSPQALVALVGQLDPNGPVASAWMVGDSVTDIQTARAAGCVAVAVRGGYDDADPIERCQPQPDHMLDRLSGVLSLLAASE
jgi:phosphoglycolate phosphatase